jgi:hypothetical protein
LIRNEYRNLPAAIRILLPVTSILSFRQIGGILCHFGKIVGKWFRQAEGTLSLRTPRPSGSSIRR